MGEWGTACKLSVPSWRRRVGRQLCRHVTRVKVRETTQHTTHRTQNTHDTHRTHNTQHITHNLGVGWSSSVLSTCPDSFYSWHLNTDIGFGSIRAVSQIRWETVSAAVFFGVWPPGHWDIRQHGCRGFPHEGVCGQAWSDFVQSLPPQPGLALFIWPQRGLVRAIFLPLSLAEAAWWRCPGTWKTDQNQDSVYCAETEIEARHATRAWLDANRVSGPSSDSWLRRRWIPVDLLRCDKENVWVFRRISCLSVVSRCLEMLFFGRTCASWRRWLSRFASLGVCVQGIER